jgi:superfamily II DNA or RNA helicase
VSSILVVSETATGKSIQMLGLVAKFKCKTLIVVPSEAIGV